MALPHHREVGVTGLRVATVVPWRGGDARRERLWDYARRWWEKFPWPLLQVEHPGPEPFNRSWCINEGARRAWPWDVLLVVDADVVEDHEDQVHAGIELAHTSGRMVAGHTAGKDLDRRTTDRILAGQGVDWNRGVLKTRDVCKSRVNAIPVELFADMGGYDERYHGWGFEDSAFIQAHEVLYGDVLHVPGCSWHLWHELSIRAARQMPDYRVSRTLVNRYLMSRSPAAVRSILEERPEIWTPPTNRRGGAKPKLAPTPKPKEPEVRTGVAIDVVCVTAGRREYLTRTLASLKFTGGWVNRRLMVDDSGDRGFARWLDEQFPEWEITHHRRNLGYTMAIRRTWERLAHADGPPHVFWIEEDFEFERPVPLGDMADVLDRAWPRLAQVVLLRHPYYPAELEAGSIPDEHPESYTRRTLGGVDYLEHARFFSSNPYLARRELFLHPWPNARHSESHVGPRLVREGYRFAFLGHGEAWIRHIGDVRAGTGY